MALLAPGSPVAWAQQGESQVMTTTEEAPKIPNDQLDSLVAPIALYPDQLLAQILAASTYPLENCGGKKEMKTKSLVKRCPKVRPIDRPRRRRRVFLHVTSLYDQI
jgi:hypothetical protein